MDLVTIATQDDKFLLTGLTLRSFRAASDTLQTQDTMPLHTPECAGPALWDAHGGLPGPAMIHLQQVFLGVAAGSFPF